MALNGNYRHIASRLVSAPSPLRGVFHRRSQSPSSLGRLNLDGKPRNYALAPRLRTFSSKCVPTDESSGNSRPGALSICKVTSSAQNFEGAFSDCVEQLRINLHTEDPLLCVLLLNPYHVPVLKTMKELPEFPSSWKLIGCLTQQKQQTQEPQPDVTLLALTTEDRDALSIETFHVEQAHIPNYAPSSLERYLFDDVPQTLAFSNRKFGSQEFLDRLDTVFSSKAASLTIVGHDPCYMIHNRQILNSGAVGVAFSGAKKLDALMHLTMDHISERQVFSLGCNQTFGELVFSFERDTSLEISSDQLAQTMENIPLGRFGFVLFPDIEYCLYIYEPRYRLAIRECVEKRLPIAVLSDGDVGTLAVITDILEILPDGRSVVNVKGIKRFKLLKEYARERSFGLSSADIQLFEDEAISFDEVADVEVLVQRLKELLRKVFTTSGAASDLKEQLASRYGPEPEDAVAFSFWLGAVLQATLQQQQRWLEMSSTKQRLQVLYSILRTAKAATEAQDNTGRKPTVLE